MSSILVLAIVDSTELADVHLGYKAVSIMQPIDGVDVQPAVNTLTTDENVALLVDDLLKHTTRTSPASGGVQ